MSSCDEYPRLKRQSYTGVARWPFLTGNTLFPCNVQIWEPGADRQVAGRYSGKAAPCDAAAVDMAPTICVGADVHDAGDSWGPIYECDPV